MQWLGNYQPTVSHSWSYKEIILQNRSTPYLFLLSLNSHILLKGNHAKKKSARFTITLRKSSFSKETLFLSSMALGRQHSLGKDVHIRTHYNGPFPSGKRKTKPGRAFRSTTGHAGHSGGGRRWNPARLPKGKFQKQFFICSYSCGKNHHHISLLINMPLLKHLF